MPRFEGCSKVNRLMLFLSGLSLRRLSKIPLRWFLVVPFVSQTVGAVVLVRYLSHRIGQQATEDLASQLLHFMLELAR